MISQLYNIDLSWTLFLDRDGVINRKREADYVKHWGEFEFLPGALEGIRELAGIFGKLLIVTNQRGVGRGIMKETDLIDIHAKMMDEIENDGGRIDQIYYCTNLVENDVEGCRKPQIGMALKAKADFPEIEFKRSIIIGDSLSDMEFGKNAGMITAFVSTQADYTKHINIDIQTESLYAFSKWIQSQLIAN